MPRTHIHLTEQQLKQIQGEAERTGLKQSEVIRRIIDKGLEPDYYKGTSIFDSVELSIPDIKSSRKNEIVIRPFNIQATRDELFNCKLYVENDAPDKVEISDNREGPFIHYTKEFPLHLGDFKAGEQRTIFVRSTDNWMQKGKIKFIGKEF